MLTPNEVVHDVLSAKGGDYNAAREWIAEVWNGTMRGSAEWRMYGAALQMLEAKRQNNARTAAEEQAARSGIKPTKSGRPVTPQLPPPSYR